MEKLILTPKELEIVVGNGSAEGAADLFTYGAEEAAARTLGSLYIVGWRQADTNTMGYMVSLIAALARREYYANVEEDPKEAFARTLRKINEVVEEFFKSEGTQLAVGVFAIAGGQIMVSKLDKFKILLAREEQVIDILNNVALFSKEHLQKRQFSSIISGSIQPGDRLLAYYPAKNIVARERVLKNWLLTESGPTLAAHLAELSTDHQKFSASFVHIDMVQTPLAVPATPPPSIPQIEPAPAPVVPEAPDILAPQLAWAPRQAAPAERASANHPPAETEQEVPNLIPTEFSLGKRHNAWRDRFGFLRVVRLDSRGKAAMLAVIATVIVGSSLIAKSIWFTSAEDRHLNEVMSAAQRDIDVARTSVDPAIARALLAQTIAMLQGTEGSSGNRDARKMTNEAIALMDELDGAHAASLTVFAQLDPDTDRVLLATYASASDSYWALTTDREEALSVVKLEDGLVARRVSITDVQPDLLLGWRSGILALDFQTRTILRIDSEAADPYIATIEEPIVDAAVFGDNLYLLTTTSIVRVLDLTTSRPVTRPWLEEGVTLPSGASRLVIDGSIHVFSPGTVTTFYRGELENTVNTAVDPSGAWRFSITGPGTLAAAVTERMRIYLFSLEDGSLAGTLKIESEQPLFGIEAGPVGSFLIVTQDNRVWLAE